MSNEKLRAVVLSALMVMSMTVGVVAVSGTAMAGHGTNQNAGTPLPKGDITDSSPDTTTTVDARTIVANVSYPTQGTVDKVYVNLTAGNNSNVSVASIDTVQVRLYNGTTLLDRASASYDAANTTVDFGGNVTDVNRTEIYATPSSGASEGQIIDAVFELAVNPTGNAYDTHGNQTILVSSTGFISGRVSDQNNNDVQNASVTFRDTNGTIVKNTTTDSEGDYTVELPPGSYNSIVRKPGFSTAQAKDLGVNSNQTTTANFVIRRLLYPDSIEVSPTADAAFVGENNSFTVTVRDQNGDPLDNVDVTATAAKPAITFVGSASQVTDTNGQAQFTVTSSQVVSSQITFEATNGSGANPTVTAQKDFIQNGTGVIQGQVVNSQSQQGGVEDASVWAVLNSTYQQNQFATFINFTGLDNDDTIWIRMVDNQTGEVIDPDDYDLRQWNFGGTPTHVAKVSRLNSSDAAVGGGYAIIDADGNGNVSFTHARLQDRDYYLEVSLDAGNSSRTTLNDESSESFTANLSHSGSPYTVVTSAPFGAGTVSSNASGNGMVFHDPAGSLTLQSAINRSQASGANLVDSPGFLNNAGFDTSGTDEDGDYILSDLYTNFQSGRTYVVIATKPGFTTDYADVFVEEDGDLVFNEGQYENSFTIEPKETDLSFRTNVTVDDGEGNFNQSVEMTDGETRDVQVTVEVKELGEPNSAYTPIQDSELVDEVDLTVSITNGTSLGDLTDSTTGDSITVTTSSSPVTELAFDAENDISGNVTIDADVGVEGAAVTSSPANVEIFTTVVLEGDIVDASTSQPLEDIQVTAYKVFPNGTVSNTSSDQQFSTVEGDVSLAVESGFEYRVEASDPAGNYQDASTRVDATGVGGTVAFSLALDPADTGGNNGNSGTFLGALDDAGDGDGTIGFNEVLNAISAFNNDQDIAGFDVGFNQVLDAISAFNSGTSV